MPTATVTPRLSYQARIEALRATKAEQTREKWEIIGSMNHDDHALVLPPLTNRKIVQAISGSGMPITDVLLDGVEIKTNYPDGAFFGPKLAGENFKALLDAHPPYVDPTSALAGAYMANFNSYRKGHWRPEFDYSHLKPEQEKYHLGTGIGAAQHFCQDLAIGLEQGWDAILTRIRYYRQVNGPQATEFYDGLEAIVLGIQDWIRRHAQAAREMAQTEQDPALRENLETLAAMNERLVTDPPTTFREACQWMLWYQMAARMYNGSGSLGRLDLLLTPFYERDTAAGTLTEEEAIWDLASLLVRDTAYIQLGGPDESGHDVTNRVSYLALEAAHRLKTPANIGVCVGNSTDPGLLRRGVEIMFEDKLGMPKFLGIDNTVEGFARNGYPLEISRLRAYSGCHWSAIPGREYTLNDCVKINFGAVFEVAYRELREDSSVPRTVDELWRRFEKHLKRAVEVLAEGFKIHLDHMQEVFPELVLDLLCHGPIEKGRDAASWGVEFYNLCIDGAALATVADSFAAIAQRVDQEQRLTWEQLDHYLDSDWAGSDGERARLMMKGIRRYGSGGSQADDWAVRVAEAFTRSCKETPTEGFILMPGLFSWANTIPMGKILGATPNGRHAGDPISHGSNPDPHFREDGAPSAMAVAIAAVQPGYGNAAPMQMEIDPGISRDEGGLEKVMDLIKTHFDLGGTQINLNVMDAKEVLEAHKDPTKYPDLIVRVTGFSAYFASLSPDFRQLVVDRIIAEG